MDWNIFLYHKILERCLKHPEKPIFKISNPNGYFSSISNTLLLNRVDYYNDVLKNQCGKICIIYHEINVDLLGFIIAAFKCNVKILIRRTTIESESKLKKDLEFVNTIIPAHLLYSDMGFEEVCGLDEEEDAEQNKYDYIQLSSGTTDSSKAYCLTAEGLIKSAVHIQKVQHVYEDAILFSYLTLSHIYGFVSGFLLPIVADSTSLLCKTSYIKNNPSLFFEILSGNKVSHTSVIMSTLLSGLQVKDQQWDLSELLCVSLGGEKIDITTFKFLQSEMAKLGMPETALVNSYGMSEKGSITMEDPFIGNFIYEKNGKGYVSVGNAVFDDTEIAILNEKYDFSEDDIEGVIGIRSPYLSKYYYQKRQQFSLCTISAGEKEWYLNGDCGFKHKNKIFITGRKVNTITYNGLKLPAEVLNDRIIEWANLCHLNINRCFCFNYPRKINYVVCLLDHAGHIDQRILTDISSKIMNEYHIYITDFWITKYGGHGLEKISLPDVIAKYSEYMNTNAGQTDIIKNPFKINELND